MKEIFLLGAGASKASGHTPLGNELVWEYHADGTSPKSYDNRNEPILDEDNKEFYHLEEFFEVVERHYPELKGLTEAYHQRGDRFFHPPFSMEKEYLVDEMLRVVQERGDVKGAELIRNLIYEHIVIPNIGFKDLAYWNFKHNILQKRIANEVSIISFNYDFLLREDFRDTISFDYLIKFDWIDENRKSIYKQHNPIPLIKLNGSLDWGICKKCNRLFLYFSPMNKDFFLNMDCNNGCGKYIRPFIVMPHENYHDKVDILWNEAKIELKNAKTITIIGYSFPEYDKGVLDLFTNNMNENVNLFIVDFCETYETQEYKNAVLQNIKEKYSKLFPKTKNKIKVSLEGFREFASNSGNVIFK